MVQLLIRSTLFFPCYLFEAAFPLCPCSHSELR
uniref:Uncharacterized protein n=1 Tax=Arundo donax TaxID=35708 RepID=A0A0A8ZVJ8_ARUDO